MFENVIMFDEINKVMTDCDTLTYYDCTFGIAVITDDCVHAVYIYDKDCASPHWSFVGEFLSKEWKKTYNFVSTLRNIRHPFEIDGSLKRPAIPF